MAELGRSKHSASIIGSHTHELSCGSQKSANQVPNRSLQETSTFYALIKHISSQHPGLNTQLSKLKSIVDTKTMKHKHTEEKLQQQIEKLSERAEYLAAEGALFKQELARKKDHENEVIYLRQKNADLADQLEGVQHQFSHALEVIEELQRKTHIKSNNLEMQSLRERQINELASSIEIQKLRVQFSAIVRQFKGEAGAYTARDVAGADLSNVVDENIKLRQKYHESQAQQVILEHKIKSLEDKLQEFQTLVASSPRLLSADHRMKVDDVTRASFDLRNDETKP